MSEEKPKEPWKDRMALVTVFLAVCATFSTFKGGGYSTQSVINQALASDQWAFYQAKSLKQHMQEFQLEQLQLQRLNITPDSAAAKAYEQHIAEGQTKMEKYEHEKTEISDKAKGFEAQRDEGKRHGKPFGIAVIFLQVAILLNSIAGLMNAKRIWWAAIPVGITGIFFFADGFFLFLTL